MKKTSHSASGTAKGEAGPAQPPRVRLPGFLSDDEIGLGDAIRRATAYLRIQPCGGCERRAATLNRWLAFGRRRSE